MLNDPELVNPVKDKVNSEKVNAEFAMDEVASMFISMFENMDNEYMKERAADIRDVTKRVLAHLLGINFSNPGTISEEVIIIAEDLTPSDTAQLNRKYAKGFTTDIGGRTSHSADYGSLYGNSSCCWYESCYGENPKRRYRNHRWFRWRSNC